MKFPGCRRDVEINMWGVTSSRDELTGDFGDGREAISIGVCDLFCRLVGKVVACILGLLQQNRPIGDIHYRQTSSTHRSRGREGLQYRPSSRAAPLFIFAGKNTLPDGTRP
jgi:hypothetical protein